VHLQRGCVRRACEGHENIRDVGRHRKNFLAHGHQFGKCLVNVFGLFLEVLGQHEIMVGHDFPELLFEAFRITQVPNADPATGNLVFVGRSDTATGGANLVDTSRTLARLVNTDVGLEDNRARQTDLQTLPHSNSIAFEFADFLQQRFRREYDAVADQALDILAKNARRNQMKGGFLAFYNQSMAGIMAALKAYHSRNLIGQQVNNLAFSFITPLGAQHYNVFTHDSLSMRPRQTTGHPQVYL